MLGKSEVINLKNKWVVILIVFAAFVVGFIVAPSKVTRVDTKEICRQEADWRLLKSIDDEGFRLAESGFGITTRMLKATTVDEYQEASQELRDNTEKVKDAGARRQAVLERLGY